MYKITNKVKTKLAIMKKAIISLTLVFAVFALANAQDLTTKKGFTILPEAGDIVIGFNAIPVVDFFLNVSNIMVNTGQTAQHPGYVGGFNQVLVGKYFIEDLKAIRVKLAINTASAKTSTFFDNPIDVFNGVADPGEVEDISKVGTSNIILGGGLELRRGHNRLQGFYGGELFLGFASNSVKNTWAVEMTQDAITNNYTNGDGTLVSAGRLLDSKSGMGITFGLRGFAGVEYFVAAKISIAAEFGWGLGMVTNPRGVNNTQTWDFVNSVAETNENLGANSGSNSGFQVDNGINQLLGASAALSMYFHF